MSLSGRLMVELALDLTSALDLASKGSSLKYPKQYDWTDGSGAGQVSKVFHDQRTLSASATEDLDLNGTALQDPLGTNLALTKVRLLIVCAASGNTNTVNVGGAASNGFTTWVGDATDVVKIRPGGALILVAPDATAYAVTAATGDLLTVTNGGGTTGVTYDVIIAGS